jgi:hypothetical protein
MGPPGSTSSGAAAGADCRHPTSGLEGAAMAFREVGVFQVREVLRLWVRGEGVRSTERLAGVDRKTVRRYVAAAVELGLVRDGGEGQLNDELVGSVVEAVRPHRVDGRGEAWRLLVANHKLVEDWLKTDELTVVKVHELLCRRGILVPQRTLHRYALEVCDVGRGRRGTTVRVADGERVFHRSKGHSLDRVRLLSGAFRGNWGDFCAWHFAASGTEQRFAIIIRQTFRADHAGQHLPIGQVLLNRAQRFLTGQKHRTHSHG